MQYDSEIRPNSKKNGSDKTNKFFIITIKCEFISNEVADKLPAQLV